MTFTLLNTKKYFQINASPLTFLLIM